MGTALEVLPAVPVAAISFILLGVLVAADLNLSQKWFTVIVVVVGFVHEVLNGVALKEGAGILGLIGIKSNGQMLDVHI